MRIKNHFELMEDGSVHIFLQQRNGEQQYGIISTAGLAKLRDLNHQWYLADMRGTKHVAAADGNRLVYLARLLNDTPVGMTCVHINGDTLDNRMNNLVNLSRSQWRLVTANASPDSVTGVRGVSVNKRGKFVAMPMYEGRSYYLGQFDRLPQAAQVVSEWYRRHMPWPFNEQ